MVDYLLEQILYVRGLFRDCADLETQHRLTISLIHLRQSLEERLIDNKRLFEDVS
jgi:hypothetical protein